MHGLKRHDRLSGEGHRSGVHVDVPDELFPPCHVQIGLSAKEYVFGRSLTAEMSNRGWCRFLLGDRARCGRELEMNKSMTQW